MASPQTAPIKLGFRAWQRLRRHWDVPLSGHVAKQMLVGCVSEVMRTADAALMRVSGAKASLRGSVVVVGHWRSGTTLLHELLTCDRRFGFLANYQCMHPHGHRFLKSQASKSSIWANRPGDAMLITPLSPQEDEFGLLCLGARSPYEALLLPSRLPDAIPLADVDALPEDEAARWDAAFVELLTGGSLASGARPLLLKSPTHSYRLERISRLIPDARFVVIVRNPYLVFESSVKMWTKMCEYLALEPIPAEGDIRRWILEARAPFERKLQDGMASLEGRRVHTIHYEDLVSNTVETLSSVYEALDLGTFAPLEPAVRQYLADHADHASKTSMPNARWREQINHAWRDVFLRYGYPLT